MVRWRADQPEYFGLGLWLTSVDGALCWCGSAWTEPALGCSTASNCGSTHAYYLNEPEERDPSTRVGESGEPPAHTLRARDSTPSASPAVCLPRDAAKASSRQGAVSRVTQATSEETRKQGRRPTDAFTRPSSASERHHAQKSDAASRGNSGQRAPGCRQSPASVLRPRSLRDWSAYMKEYAFRERWSLQSDYTFSESPCVSSRLVHGSTLITPVSVVSHVTTGRRGLASRPSPVPRLALAVIYLAEWSERLRCGLPAWPGERPFGSKCPGIAGHGSRANHQSYRVAGSAGPRFSQVSSPRRVNLPRQALRCSYPHQFRVLKFFTSHFVVLSFSCISISYQKIILKWHNHIWWFKKM